jgi:Family of unknown function (DUF5681)
MNGEPTPAKTPANNLRPPWQPGESGNPAGRPKGARSKLGEDFINALRADFEKHGIETVEKVRVDRPADYIKVVASLLPKEISGPDSEPIAFTEIRRVIVDPED